MKVLTVKEAAEMLKVPARTVQYLVGTNQIPFFRVGKRSVRFNTDRLEEWSREREGVALRYKTGTDE